MSKQGKDMDPLPGRLKQTEPESKSQTLSEEEIKRQALVEFLKKYSGLNISVEEAVSQELTKLTNNEPVSNAEASGSSGSAGNDCDYDKISSKSRRKSVKTSGSENEEHLSQRDAGGDIAVSAVSLSKPTRSVKSSGSEDEETSSKRGVLKVSRSSADDNDTKGSTSLPKKPQRSKISGPKQSTSAIGSESKERSDLSPELKPIGAVTKGLTRSSEPFTGHPTLEKPTKNNSEDGDKRTRRMSTCKVTQATKAVPTKKETNVNVEAKSKELLQSAKTKLKRTSKVRDNTKAAPTTQSLPMTLETSVDVQVNELMTDTGSQKKKARRHSKVEDSTNADLTTQSLPITQETSVELREKVPVTVIGSPKKKFSKPIQGEDMKKISETTKSLPKTSGSAHLQVKKSRGKIVESLKKDSQKHVKVDNVSPEDHGNQLTREESDIGADNHHNLRHHFDKLTDSTTLIQSWSQHALDETHQKDLEHDIIAKIEERGKINTPAVKRKSPDLEHNSSMRQKIVKNNENCDTLVTSEASDSETSSPVFRKDLRVILSRLSQEYIAASLSPPKISTVEQDKQLPMERSSQVSDRSKIPKTDLFVKPAIPKKSNTLKNKVASNIKSRNVAKKTGKSPKNSQPIESGVQKNPIKLSESDCQKLDPFPNLYAAKKYVNPLDKLKMDTEELDYEPGAGDDDDSISIFAYTDIFEDEDKAHVQKQDRDSDKDSVDSRRLSDMEIDSDDDNCNDVPPDAQDEPSDSRLDGNISAPISQKENVLGIPVEVYPACNLVEPARETVELGDLVNDKDSDPYSKPGEELCGTDKMAENVISDNYDSLSPIKTKTLSPPCKKKKKTETKLSPKPESKKVCIENLQCVKDVMKGDNRRQGSSTDMKRRSEVSKLSTYKNTCGSSGPNPCASVETQSSGVKFKTLQERNSNQISSSTEAAVTSSPAPAKSNPQTAYLRCPVNNGDVSIMQQECVSNLPAVLTGESVEVYRTTAPSTPPRKANEIPNLLTSNTFNECDMEMRNMDRFSIPGVHFPSPKRGPFRSTPPLSTGLRETPDQAPYVAVHPISAALPLQPGNPNSRMHTEPPQPSTLAISQFLQDMRPIGECIPATSTNIKSPLGILPIQDQFNHHHKLSLKDVDLRQHHSPLQSLVADDDPDVNSLMLYCLMHLTNGKCNNDNCSKLHEFPELPLDGHMKRDQSIKLIEKMLNSYPFWRDNCFSSVVETLGFCCDKVSLGKVAEKLWSVCCLHLLDKTKVDYNCWKQLAQAFLSCALEPAFCTRVILNKVLLPQRKNLGRQFYAVIDNIVDVLFDDFIKGASNLWFCLSILASLKDYEIPANVMREILRDSLLESRDVATHREICDYLLRSPTIQQPRNPEESELLHFIHQLLFVLQQKDVTFQRAQKLADHYQIPLKNDCCVGYAKQIEANAVARAGPQCKRFSLSTPLINKASHENSKNNQLDSLQPRLDNAVPKSVLNPIFHTPCNVVQNLQNRRNSKDFGAVQSTSVSFLNSAMESEVTSSSEVVNSKLLPTNNDREIMNLKTTSENMIVTTATSISEDSLEIAAPVRISTNLNLKIVAMGSARSVITGTDRSVPTGTDRSVPTGTDRSVPTGTDRSVPTGTDRSVPTGTDKSVPTGTDKSVPIETQRSIPTGTQRSIPTGTRRSVRTGARRSATESEPADKQIPLLNLIKKNKCGKAAKFIISWKGNAHATSVGTQFITQTLLLSMGLKERILSFQSLLQAITAQMAGNLDDQLKAIMIPIGLSLLEDFLRTEHYTEANEVHDVLWRKMNPPSVQLEQYSLSYFQLITAWVYVKNGKVKEALGIVSSNSFHSSTEHWSIPSNPSDKDLRDNICTIIFNHCKGIDDYVLDAETLFRNMLEAKECYQIDVSQFFDDILRALVNSDQYQRALALLVWAYNSHALKPLRPVTNRLILTYVTSLPRNSEWTPEVLHLLQQEPYNEAFPQRMQGLSRINVCLPSVWNMSEVHCLFTFLFKYHICKLSTQQDIPHIAVEIKECQLPTQAPGDFLFPDRLLKIDPSVPAMQKRVNQVISKLPIQNNSRFANGRLELDRSAVCNYVTLLQRTQDAQASVSQHPRQSSSRTERPIYSGRKRGDAYPVPNRSYPNAPNYEWVPSVPSEESQWEGHASNPYFQHLPEESYSASMPQDQNQGYNQYSYGSSQPHFAQYQQGSRPFRKQTHRGQWRSH